MKTKKRIGGKLPSYDELLRAAERVAGYSNIGRDGRPRYDEAAIVGGLAMQIWGSPRLTADLDVIAESDLGYTGEPLSFGGVRTKEESVDLDVIVRSDEWEGLYSDALANAVEVTDVPMPVVIPEFLVPMKMVAGRSKDESDIRYLVLLDDFDFKLAETIVREHLGSYAVRELRTIIEEAKWRKSRGEE